MCRKKVGCALSGASPRKWPVLAQPARVKHFRFRPLPDPAAGFRGSREGGRPALRPAARRAPRPPRDDAVRQSGQYVLRSIIHLHMTGSLLRLNIAFVSRKHLSW